MRPTRPWLPPVEFAVAAGVVYLLLSQHHSLLPSVSIAGPIAIAVLAFGEFVVARTTRARLAGRPGTKPIEPITVARLAALAKASTLVAAALTGVYAGLLARVLQLDSPVAVGDVRSGAAGLGGTLLLTAAGLALERTCRVKQPPPSGEQ